MKKKYRLILLFILLVLVLIYIKTIHPYIQRRNVKAELAEEWEIDIAPEYKLTAIKKNKQQWHGEQQKFILFESDNLSNLYKYINDNNFNQDKIGLDSIKRVVEIEDILNVERKYRVDFDSDYLYKMFMKQKVSLGSEQKNDLLYVFLIKKNNKIKVFFIEDLNVLDLERSLL
ncbi:hypothetical protein [Tissierella praeacuta]|uniref:hypothetical protein n=1 Tax=Tissierella praeacuta TaxID=43131 RepID=UPI00333F7762